MPTYDELIAGLRELRKPVAAELSRIDRALAALTEDGEAPSTPATTSGERSAAGVDTLGALRSLFRSNAGRTFTAEEATAALTAEGWRSEAADPVNTIRGALSRLHQMEEIQRVARGRYQLADLELQERSQPPTAAIELHPRDSEQPAPDEGQPMP